MNLYHIAHVLRDNFDWLWNLVEKANSWLFILRYGRRLKDYTFTTIPDGYSLMAMKDVPTDELVAFFSRQPEDTFTFFRPHGFDEKSLRRLQRNLAFLGYILRDNAQGEIAGYCFIRSFFHGQGFRGRMVDVNYRGKGLGTAMNKILNEVGFGIGLRLFESVSKDNVASYRSAMSASNVKVVKELPHNELYLEILPD